MQARLEIHEDLMRQRESGGATSNEEIYYALMNDVMYPKKAYQVYRDEKNILDALVEEAPKVHRNPEEFCSYIKSQRPTREEFIHTEVEDIYSRDVEPERDKKWLETVEENSDVETAVLYAGSSHLQFRDRHVARAKVPCAHCRLASTVFRAPLGSGPAERHSAGPIRDTDGVHLRAGPCIPNSRQGKSAAARRRHGAGEQQPAQSG